MYYGFAEPVIIAGPRNAHRRPLIPPLAILFSSLLARPVHPPLDAGASLFPGPNRPLAPRDCASFSPLAVPPSRRRFVASRRCAHSIIIIGSRSWTADALSLTAFNPSAVRFSPSFPSFVLVYLRDLSPEFRCSPLQIDRRGGLADATRRTPTFSPVPSLRAEKYVGIYYRNAR